MTNLRVKLTSIKINFNGTQIVDFHSSNFLSVPFCWRRGKWLCRVLGLFFFFRSYFLFSIPLQSSFSAKYFKFSFTKKCSHHTWMNSNYRKIDRTFCNFFFEKQLCKRASIRIVWQNFCQKILLFEILDIRCMVRWHKFLIWLDVWINIWILEHYFEWQKFEI